MGIPLDMMINGNDHANADFCLTGRIWIFSVVCLVLVGFSSAGCSTVSIIAVPSGVDLQEMKRAPGHTDLSIVVVSFWQWPRRRHNFEVELAQRSIDPALMLNRWGHLRTSKTVRLGEPEPETDLTQELAKALREFGYKDVASYAGARGNVYLAGYLVINDYPWPTSSILNIVSGLYSFLPIPMRWRYGDSYMIIALYGEDRSRRTVKSFKIEPSLVSWGVYGQILKGPGLLRGFVKAIAAQSIQLIEEYGDSRSRPG